MTGQDIPFDKFSLAVRGILYLVLIPCIAEVALLGFFFFPWGGGKYILDFFCAIFSFYLLFVACRYLRALCINRPLFHLGPDALTVLWGKKRMIPWADVQWIRLERFAFARGRDRVMICFKIKENPVRYHTLHIPIFIMKDQPLKVVEALNLAHNPSTTVADPMALR